MATHDMKKATKDATRALLLKKYQQAVKKREVAVNDLALAVHEVEQARTAFFRNELGEL